MGTRVPLSDVEFDDMSRGFQVKWRFKAPPLLQLSIPPPEETVVITGKTADLGMLELGQATGCELFKSRNT